MIIKPKEKLDNSIKEELQKYVYDIIGVIQDVHSELPQGMPEYLYQEYCSCSIRVKPCKRISASSRIQRTEDVVLSENGHNDTTK